MTKIHARSPSPAAPIPHAVALAEGERASKRQRLENETPSGARQKACAIDAGKAQRTALLREVHTHSYGSPISDQKTHKSNVEKVHEQIEAFIDEFLFNNPTASPGMVRQEVSRNTAKFVVESGFDPGCYMAKGNGKHDYGKHVIFSSRSIPLFKNQVEWPVRAGVLLQTGRGNPGVQ